MTTTSVPRRVAIVTNIVAPYRIPMLRELGRLIELRVFYSAEKEPNRQWAVAHDLPFSNEIVGGRVIPLRGKYIYISPGLISRLAAFRPSAVVIAGFSVPALYALFYCALTGAKVIIMDEGTRHTERALGAFGRLSRWALVRAAKAYIAAGTLSTERFCELGAEPTHCVVVPCASFDLAGYPRRDYSSASAVPRILYVGQFIERKGVLQLIDAVDRVRTCRPVSLTIVGHGPLDETLRSLISGRRLAPCVTVRGFVDQTELPRLYAEHDLFAFPSLEEVFGVVLLEAMAAGLPAISSCFAGATPDFVEAGKTGWIMDPSSPDGIVGALDAALNARHAWPDLGAAARKRIEETSPQRAAREVVRALDIAERLHS